MSFLEHKYVRFVRNHISLIAFMSGFVWDTLTLTRIDLLYENFVFISYLTIAATAILLLHAVETGRFSSPILKKYKAWLPLFVQFPLGGLFSGFVIFYSKSASLLTSWPFLLLLVGLFIGNEFFRRRYERLVFQVSVFYFTLFTYLVLTVPIVLGTIGISTFVLAGLLSLFLIGLYLQLLMRLFPEMYRRSMARLWFAVGCIYLAFNALYFLNIIPPVPLALTEVGIYHSVVRTDTGYAVTYEAPNWYNIFYDTSTTFTTTGTDAAYCFSSIFAPTRLRTSIFHTWDRYVNGRWVEESRIPYTIQGGRERGYRGYTLKQNIIPGSWRCSIETDAGQVLGVMLFDVVMSDTPALVEGGLR